MRAQLAARGFSAATGAGRPLPALPASASGAGLAVVNAGLGSMLQCQLTSPSDTLYAAPHTILGVAGTVRRENLVERSVTGAVLRRAAGGPFFMQAIRQGDDASNSTPNAASVLLAPQSVGDIALVSMADVHGQCLHLQRRVFLAAMGPVTLCSRVGGGLGVGVDGKLMSLEACGGEGTVALHSPNGALFRLSLAAGEEYHVRPRNILAWSAPVRPQLALDGVQTESALPVGASLMRLLQHWLLSRVKQTSLHLRRSIKSRLVGDKASFYRLVGPGDYYIASHLPARFDGVLSAYVAVKQQTDLVRESLKVPTSLSINEPNITSPPPVAVSTATVDHGIVTFNKQNGVKVKEEEVKAPVDAPSPPSTPPATTSKWRRLLFGQQQQAP